MTEIAQEMQDKFRQAVIDKIKQHFPDTDIKSPLIINNEAHFAMAVNMAAYEKPGYKIDSFPMVFGGSGSSLDDAIDTALEDMSKIRFLKVPSAVYIRSSDVCVDKDFSIMSVTYDAKARVYFLYEEK